MRDGGRHVRHLHRLVDAFDLLAIIDSECFVEAGAIVGIDGRAFAGATDHDINGASIDGVGPQSFKVGQDPIARSPLRGMDRPHPTGCAGRQGGEG